ncbi:hypothetical protein GF323_01065 [Candidatus Woesearchaeota archaeon]|nr:hypothetical protein [Candidatus Woesearchaeota archaeon]
MVRMKSSLGICIGASTIKIVEIDDEYNINKEIIKNHECNPRQALKDLLDEIDPKKYDYITLTGRKFKDLLDLPKITEPEATEYALRHFLKAKKNDFNALISLGSENFILYGLQKGNIISVHTGNKCASGTGEFFLQQTRRMNVSVEEAINLAEGSEPYYVSGRCSVFCKSDCTHALNKGIPAGRVCAGLGDMIAEKILELLKSIKKENIILVGGVTNNRYVVDRLRENIENIVIPYSAGIFEAFGAAVYALQNKKMVDHEIYVKEGKNSFSTLPSLREAEKLVEFKEHKRGKAKKGDVCILGLDVGSTTTKAVLLRKEDDSVLASVYLRTNGNPVKASRECYAELYKQLNGTQVNIIGLGVTGSGRKIAGLHAMTDGIINEIIAHATGATYYDKDVDTIIEIGGQDAKYTYLVNGVACDYAMNEACSAGTGSFLEEAAKESLNIDYRDIQDIAKKAEKPPNFNDQCAAFISSDIKNASHEDISREDIVAGLVYSICMNYNNRVKGARKTGSKVFMQGGVCYNKAVPLAMASILQKPIIVPPDPGLIGAFGVSLEIKNRLEHGLIKEKHFDLKELKDRRVEYGKTFACTGQPENCDRACQINVIKLNGKSYPFGGICNKYYNMMHKLDIDPKPLDIVEKRNEIMFRKKKSSDGKTVGISKALYTNILFPLYYTFFTELGFKVILPDKAEKEGMKKVGSSFCFPVEISHGMFKNLLDKDPDYIFLPQVSEFFVKNSIHNGEDKENHCACVIGQAEPYYLQSAFRKIKPKFLSPVLNFYKGWETASQSFIVLGKEMGKSEEESKRAFDRGVGKLKQAIRDKKKLGNEILKQIESDPTKTGIVLFGRAYNAFAEEANLGIPRKFASRGFYIIPYELLSFEEEEALENMNWALGQDMIKCARLVKKHPQLFGAYITNFSCGPDSFLVGYFRDIMKTKPSLTLELDSHSADAGINTRIEAFLDIVSRYKKLGIKDTEEKEFKPAYIRMGRRPVYVASDGKEYPLKDKRVKMIIPSMGRNTAELTAAAFRRMGINASAVDLPDFQTLMLGRGNTSCKECLPLILTTGSLLDYLKKRKSTNEMLIYFMPTTNGSCRFSQYYVFIKKLIEKKQLKNVAIYSLSAENRYAGMGIFDQLKILQAIIIADILEDIRSAVLVLPEDKEKAMEIYKSQRGKIIDAVENGKNVYNSLETAAHSLSRIQLRYPIHKAKKVLMAGEIYVRRDEFSSQRVLQRLAKRDIIVKRAPVLEWLYYVDYIMKNEVQTKLSLKEKTDLLLREFVQKNIEQKVKKTMAHSGLYEHETIDMETIMDTGRKFMDQALTGEAIIVVGSFFHELTKHIHGMISIGPFACLPTRITEAILSKESCIAGNERLKALHNIDQLQKHHTLPFLSVEADGNPFPQIVEARIEAFALQVEKLYKERTKNI